jgi:RND family efflux transporter MFP subunit
LTAQAAAVSQIEAQLEALVVRTEDSHIKAPFSGTIAGRHIDTGTTVEAGQRILTIMEATRLEARVGLPTDVARSLDATEAYSFLWRNNSVSGRVKAVMPQVDPTTRNQIVVFEIEPTGDAMPVPGDIIRLELSTVIRSRGFWLPLTSLTKGTRGLWSAFVVSKDPDAPDTIRSAALEVIYTDGDRAYVRGTLEDGDQVVASGSHRVVPGQQVGPVAEASR